MDGTISLIVSSVGQRQFETWPFRFPKRSKGLILLALLFGACGTHANPKIRTSFFSVYPDAVDSRLDNLPSQSRHCGVCHYDFKNGGNPWNPYGQSIRDMGGLNSETGRTNAIWTVRGSNEDADGYTAQTEISDLSYANTPTFPGLSAANYGQAVNIPLSEIQPYLTPITSIDTNAPSIVVLIPNGGETFTANRTTNITWNATDVGGVAAIHIFESLDNGATFSPVASGLPNTGVYVWVPANRPTTTARIRVVAVDASANSTNDISDAAFAIVSPPGGRVATTLRDFDMPGTQPFQGGPEFSSPQECAACHGDYDSAVEPYRNWQGSMMAHAARDPLFEANMVIANQDAPDSGDLCLRCHFSNGWLQGRSVPTDGSGMLPADRHGVSCDHCHRMADPVYKPGISPPQDTNILAALTFPGTNYGNGMFVIDPSSIQRGPFTNTVAPHSVYISGFHRSSAFCGTCHDVSNPAFTEDGGGTYQLNTLNSTSGVYAATAIGPVERTYSEWLNSAYNSSNGVYAPVFAGNKPDGMVSTCQDCHLRDVSGYGCNTNLNAGVPLRPDLPLHDMTGGSTWIPALLTNLYPAEVNAAAIQAGIARAEQMLQNAASLSATYAGGFLKVTVTNQCGHKLPTGYPEGRRIWLNVKFFDSQTNLLTESGAYDPSSGVLTHDAEAKIYEVHPGIDTNIAGAVGLPAGPSLHFVLNNKIYEDNRIPPRGFSNVTYAAFGGAPIGHSYADGQYWDDTLYSMPPGTRRAEIRLYYQSTTKEFVEFLRDENVTNNKGQEMYDLWSNNGKCPPTLMAQASWEPSALAFSGLETAAPGIESATLAWSAVSSTCQVTYSVFQSLTSGGQNFSSPVLTTTALGAEISPLDPGTTNALTYYFVVRASDSCGGAEFNTVERSVQPLLDPAKDQDADGLPNGWEQDSGLDPFASAGNQGASGDPDGDGKSNIEEFAAGTDPLDRSSTFRILSIGAEGSDVRIVWATAGGRTNVVQVSGSLVTYSNISPQIVIPGTADAITNYLDPGALTNLAPRFYRIQAIRP